MELHSCSDAKRWSPVAGVDAGVDAPHTWGSAKVAAVADDALLGFLVLPLGLFLSSPLFCELHALCHCDRTSDVIASGALSCSLLWVCRDSTSTALTSTLLSEGGVWNRCSELRFRNCGCSVHTVGWSESERSQSGWRRQGAVAERRKHHRRRSCCLVWAVVAEVLHLRPWRLCKSLLEWQCLSADSKKSECDYWFHLIVL